MGKVLFLRKGSVHTAPIALPSGYTKLAYIQGTGTQYLDTGLTVNKADAYKLELTADLVSSDNYAGCNGYMQFQAKIGGGAKSEIVVDYANVTETISVNGVQISSNDWSTYDGVNVKLGLFKMGDTGNSWFSGAPQSGKIYSAKIYKSGTLVRDFLPCMNADGATGLYDLVGKQFYGNAGTGVFLSNLAVIVPITADNIGTYFTVTNGSYKFAGSGSVFTSDNKGVNSSTASTVLTAKQDIAVLAFSYSYSSEQNYDKFTLKVGGTTVENAVSGATTSKTYSGSLSQGQTVEFTYVKDRSQHANNDQCTFSDMYITIQKGAA